ncbi:MAG: ATP-binding protein [Candidatus Anstonellales archaeon]
MMQRLFASGTAWAVPLVSAPEPSWAALYSSASEGVYIGRTLFRKVPVLWNPSRLVNPHIVVVGMSGSGKSYLLKTFITRASILWKTNTVIIDWVGEYVRWVEQAGGTVYRLGKHKFNVLSLQGISPGEKIKGVMGALDILLGLKQYPEERADIEDALQKMYSRKRQDIVTLYSLLRKSKSKAARLVKTMMIQGSDVFSEGMSIDTVLSKRLTCIDLSQLPSEDMKSLAGLAVLQLIKEKMRKKGVSESKGVELIVVLDEAWKVARSDESDLIAIVREGRKYNFSVIVASQSPEDIHPDVLSNSGTAFMFRMISGKSREYMRKSLGFSSFVEESIASAPVGQCAVSMAFSKKKAGKEVFMLERVEGEEPFLVYSIGGKMDVKAEREKVIRLMEEAGLEEQQVTAIKEFFEDNEGSVDSVELAKRLQAFGVSRVSIMMLFRSLGAKEEEIMNTFALMSTRKGKVAEVVLDDD